MSSPLLFGGFLAPVLVSLLEPALGGSTLTACYNLLAATGRNISLKQPDCCAAGEPCRRAGDGHLPDAVRRLMRVRRHRPRCVSPSTFASAVRVHGPAHRPHRAASHQGQWT